MKQKKQQLDIFTDTHSPKKNIFHNKEVHLVELARVITIQTIVKNDNNSNNNNPRFATRIRSLCLI